MCILYIYHHISKTSTWSLWNTVHGVFCYQKRNGKLHTALTAHDIWLQTDSPDINGQENQWSGKYTP